MNRINLNRSKALQNIARSSNAWGKKLKDVGVANIGAIHALAFSAVLIACSIAVGCSSDHPKSVSSNNQIPATPAPTPIAATTSLTLQADAKPAPKKVVHKKPATVNYTDKTYGVTFEYPRRYAIETGDAASELLLSSPVPMNFVQPGGVALAAVELPETGFANTDFSSAFFNVSVHKAITADQCNEFAVPQPKNLTANPTQSTETVATSSAPVAANATDNKTQAATLEQPKPDQSSAARVSDEEAPSTASTSEAESSRLILKDMELRGTEAVSGEGTRQSDSKYFHVFQNGACYEFALNVTTVASQEGMTKHVDRDKVFSQLEKIMATVQIDATNAAAPAPAVTAEKTVTATPAPAQ